MATPAIGGGGVNTLPVSELTGSAQATIAMLTAAGWLESEILSYFEHPQPGVDRAYEDAQRHDHGEVRITAAAMRAEIRRLLTH